MKSTLGSDKVPVPKDPNDQEAWDRYYIAGGRPPEPKAYQIEKPEKLPEGMIWDDNMEGWWKRSAFEADCHSAKRRSWSISTATATRAGR